MAGFPSVICDILQALPHTTRAKAGAVGFDLSPILMLCLLDGLSESVAQGCQTHSMEGLVSSGFVYDLDNQVREVLY